MGMNIGRVGGLRTYVCMYERNKGRLFHVKKTW